MVLVIYQLFEHFYSSSSSGGSGHQNRSDKITTIKATEIRTRETISKKKIFFACYFCNQIKNAILSWLSTKN